MNASALSGGFVNSPIDAANAFRQIMTIMARPGDLATITGAQPPQPLSVAAGTVLLTLCDPETPVFLAPRFDIAAIRDWVTFHTGAPLGKADIARFAIGNWDELRLSDFQIGTPEYPDRSATLIVEMQNLIQDGATLRGPGIKDRAALSLPETVAFQRNAAQFPQGLDFFFTSGSQIAALPRTTKVT